MKPTIIAVNWKMHKTLQEGLEWVQKALDYLNMHSWPSTKILLFPSFIHLESIYQLVSSQVVFQLGAQNCNDQISGAFTGEVSASMLASVGVRYVLIGHSERRQYFAESHEQIARKIDATLQFNMQPIFCCGEPWEIRENNQHDAYIEQQIRGSLFHLAAKQIQQVMIAYEPIWAIGSGKTPDIIVIESIQAAIRNLLVQRYGSLVGERTLLLYGGSCNANNIRDFTHMKGMDGVLIGNASLHVKDFLYMLNALQKS